MNRRNLFKTLFGAVVATIVPLPEFKTLEDSKLPKFLISMVRRVFPTIIASELVGIHPMDGPSGTVFYMKYK